MTRINCGIPPVELSNKHLLAEHREMKRIPNVVRKGRFSLKGQPSQFTLGTGHVKFFYDKLGYLLDRYKQVYAECKARGFNVTDFSDSWQGIDPHLMGNYNPTERDKQLIRQRIKQRLAKMAP